MEDNLFFCIMTENWNTSFRREMDNYLPSASIDLVIFGFHENQLKILLLKNKDKTSWSLPGGFIYKTESLEAAAKRILSERTGLNEIFLQQFHVFGDPERTKENNRSGLLEEQIGNDEVALEIKEWILGRFITVGYYALLEFTEVQTRPDIFSLACSWHDHNSLPALISDHGQIISSALSTLRQHLNYQPVGMNLLPKEFTMPELLRLYETILGKSLDRRNFQRKMLSYHILERLPEKRTGGAFKAPYLYRFNEDNYQQALQNGLKDLW